MAEVLFVLLTIYVVYVVQSVFSKKEPKTEEKPVKKAVVSAEIVSDKEQKVVVAQAKPATKKVAPVKRVATKTTAVKAKPASKPKAKAKPKAKEKTAVVSGSLRNPETGDVDKIATSYRMTKRWIKDALVTEGLLPKVYKTTELDDATKLKAKKAIDKLSKMDKYQ